MAIRATPNVQNVKNIEQHELPPARDAQQGIHGQDLFEVAIRPASKEISTSLRRSLTNLVTHPDVWDAGTKMLV